MTLIGFISDEDFEADFPIDFGKGVRGYIMEHRNKPAGVILCHRFAGDIGCAVSVYWTKVNEHQKLYTRTTPVSEPLTIEEDVRCSCSLHGWIREGRWEHAHDSLL